MSIDKAKKLEEKQQLKTPMGRISYPNLFQARGMEGSEPSYNCVLIFDEKAQQTPEYKAMKKAAELAAKEKWPKGVPAGIRNPFRDGAEKDQDGYGSGKIFITVRSKQKPGVVAGYIDKATGKVAVIDDETYIEAGDYVRAIVRPYAYDNKGNKGVAFGLQGIQFIKKGEPLGNRVRAEDAFDAVESEEGDSEESADEMFG